MNFPRVFCLSVWLVTSSVYATEASTASSTSHRFTFSFPFSDADDMRPRGSTSTGAPVTLDTSVSEAWQSLRAVNISTQERDRRAILAMAGEYRVSFDFLEIVQFDTTAPQDRPYQTWSTEKVYVVENRPDFISLQHILVMHILDDQGQRRAPAVIKHWRQDWQYEPRHLDEYQGPVRWQRRALPKSQSRGRWSQSAYQVDDSPRYAALGRWQHNASFSTWIGNDTLRPLPRREYTFRDDYQVLVASNRHTILPSGWVQEENNLKQRVTQQGLGAAPHPLPFAAREYGIARYQHIRDGDFSAGDRYWARSSALWAEVRTYWEELFEQRAPICLIAAPDQKQLFVPLFELADDAPKLLTATPAQLRIWARQKIDGYLKTCTAGAASNASY